MYAFLAALLSLVSLGAETYVVCAGVEKYDDDGISALQFAAGDARAVAAAFREAGVPDEHISILTSDADERLALPTKANFLRALKAARVRARESDTLVVLFSGHGIERGGETYLLTMDTDSSPGLLATTAVAMGELSQALLGLQAANLLLIIDACRNDPDAGKGTQDARLDEAFAKGLRPKLAAGSATRRQPNIALLLACEVGQRAWEFPEERHGALTYWLLKGLRAEAPRSVAGVAVTDLAAYLQREVPAWADRAGRRQTPRFERLSGTSFTLPAPSRQDHGPKQPSVGADSRVRPANWPGYLSHFAPPPGMSWSDFRVSSRDGMPQVRITAGEFLMGTTAEQLEAALRLDGMKPEYAADEQPARRVHLPDYWMDLHEVTNAQYCRFLNESGQAVETSWLDPAGAEQKAYWANVLGSGIEIHGGAYRPVIGREQHPVVWVSWEGAAAYARWAGRHLPTEAQWERAARGGQDGMLFVWGNSSRPPHGAGNVCDEAAKRRWTEWASFTGYADGYETTGPVGSFAPNGYGLYDLAGNVWEWCRDWYDGGWYGEMSPEATENTMPSQARSVRGGSYGDDARYLRLACRSSRSPADRYSHVGFRCAAAAP